MTSSRPKRATRAEAAAFIARQLDFDTVSTNDENYRHWHYGKMQLRELMDYIYGGPPKTPKEEVK